MSPPLSPTQNSESAAGCELSDCAPVCHEELEYPRGISSLSLSCFSTVSQVYGVEIGNLWSVAVPPVAGLATVGECGIMASEYRTLKSGHHKLFTPYLLSIHFYL